jgi:hypothetical protein
MGNAEFALVAKIRKIAEIRRLEAAGIPVDVRSVERPEQNVERRTQVVTAAARVTDVGHAPQLLLDRGGRIKIVGRRIEQT